MNQQRQTPLIKVQHLKKSFDEKNVLVDVSFNLYKGENLVIMGKSGSGKSVLLKILVGLIEPDDGDVCVLGNNIRKLNEDELTQLRKKIGYVFQEGALYDSMTARENVGFSLRRKVSRKSTKDIENLVDKSLGKVGLKDSAEKMPDELSGGMKKRVSLARVIIMEPEIILYDEPTSGLDSITSGEISRLISDMKNDLGVSSIISTHDLAAASKLADRVIILDKGIIIAEGSFETLLNSRNSYIRQFFSV